MPKSKRQVEAALEAKGFDRDPEADHVYFTYRGLDGRLTAVYTKTSHGHGGRDLSDELLARMARQCRLRRRDFDRLVDCQLDQAGYDKILQDSDEI